MGDSAKATKSTHRERSAGKFGLLDFRPTINRVVSSGLLNSLAANWRTSSLSSSWMVAEVAYARTSSGVLPARTYARLRSKESSAARLPV